MYEALNKLPRSAKASIFIFLDMISIAVALFVSIGLRLNTTWPMERFLLSWRLVVVLLVCGLVFSFFFKLHSIKLRSYESSEIVRYMMWCGSLMIVGTITNAAFQLGAPRTVPIIFGSIVCLFTMAFRFSALQILEILGRNNAKRTRVAVYGAGAAGLQLISALKRSKEYAPVLFLDDSSAMQGLIISGLRVYSPSHLIDFLKKNHVEKVLMAIPSASPNRKRQIIRSIKELDCEVLELPSYVDMIQSGGVVPSLRPVSPEDLLGRDGVDLELPELANTYANASVLVSGAGGSIGSELCRKIIKIGARKLVLFEQSEFSLYSIEKELKPFAKTANIELVAVLGSVLDENRLRSVLMDQEVEIVLHAAAYKHVPIVEDNVLEGVRNNVVGTNRIAEVSAECGVKRFTLISTDKAVRPTNVMGASKRLAELAVQDCQI
ncbi:MAG: polysaccharide biosynthesis protein, partial [Hyphomicrobiales bacterium]